MLTRHVVRTNLATPGISQFDEHPQSPCNGFGYQQLATYRLKTNATTYMTYLQCNAYINTAFGNASNLKL